MASPASSEVSEGPVLSLISKRLRALRKKLNRIAQMEESLSQGKPLNKEQHEFLRSKPSISAIVDELEKLRQPLSASVQEEIDLAIKTHKPESTLEPESTQLSGGGFLEDLVKILYFGSLFDVKSQSDFGSLCLVRTHERECCLSYDCVTDDDSAVDLLREEDLDLMSRLSGLLISRPADSGFSHRDALRRCIEHARAWLAKSDDPIEPDAKVTYGELRGRLEKIVASDYFTTAPEIKPPALEMAAAAAAANYSPFQVSVQGVGVPVLIQGEGSVVQYPPQKDDETATYQEQETGGNQSSSLQEQQKDEVAVENPSEDVSVQQEQVNQEVEVDHNQREHDSKEQQYNPQRGYPNQRERGGRGGGRRGYSNGRGGRGGRGGGPYQNGRYQQYDQPGNYQPRGGYQNNRGGGGRRGGYNNHRGSTVQGGLNPSEVGVGA